MTLSQGIRKASFEWVLQVAGFTSAERDWGRGTEYPKGGNSKNKGKELGKGYRMFHVFSQQTLMECLVCQRAGQSPILRELPVWKGDGT